jgi:hypothetical protein
MKNMISWLIVLAQRGWIWVKFVFRRLHTRLDRIVYIAKEILIFRRMRATDHEWVQTLPGIAYTVPVVRRWLGEIRDASFFNGISYDKFMAMVIIEECQRLFRLDYFYNRLHDERQVRCIKKRLYQKAKLLKTPMQLIHISETVNYLLRRMSEYILEVGLGMWKEVRECE